MSSQRGNASRTRPQKHQNRSAFKNNLHDISNRTKLINSIQVSDVCMRCKEIIEWKIKYKKYKPLTQPKTCVKCGQKAVKKAYHVMCSECGKNLRCCTKCCQDKEIVQVEQPKDEQPRLDAELKALLQSLPERKRRTFLRYMNKKDKGEEPKIDAGEEDRKDLFDKLKSLKIEEDDDDLDFLDEEEEESGEDTDGS
ncbi:uncharacterized protein C9orf85 homolog [Leptinotarsa decemlineata]|uniref:uncharacterized protein C9orf85 homolog n=1 Tax=Leptinotarsa decemlineata TaxID=7539 RepID=UPI003D3089A4